MTEYDYSPDAWERYIETQHRIARWVDGTQQQAPCNAFDPATPHLQAIALKDQERRRRYHDEFAGDDDSDSSDTEYRKRSHHPHRSRSSHHKKSSSSRHRKYDKGDADLDREYVFVETASSVQRSVQPTRTRRGPRNLTLDLTPFPTSGVIPQDPYSYRNSGHSSHSSNTTTPTNLTPTHQMSYHLPPQPYSAPAATGRAPMLGGGRAPAPKPMRSQTMPMTPGYMQPYPHNPAAYHHMGMGYPQPGMLPSRPGGKGYAYGPDPSKTTQVPWSDYIVPASPTSTKPPSLLKRMFTGLTSSKHQQPQQQPQPQPQQYQYQQKYTQSQSPSKSSKGPKEPNMFLGGGGSKRMTRKRSVSF